MSNRYLSLRNRAKHYRARARRNCRENVIPAVRGLQYAFLADYFQWLAARELLAITNRFGTDRSAAMRQINFWAKEMRNSYEILRYCTLAAN